MDHTIGAIGAALNNLSSDIYGAIVSLSTPEGIVGLGQHILNNPFFIVMALLIYKTISSVKSETTIPKDAVIRTIVSSQEWTDLLKEAKEADKKVIVAFYKPWLPNCKWAMRTFHKMSAEYEDTIFATIDSVDADQKPLAQLHKTYDIKQYPTLKLLYNEKQVETMEGWSDDGLRYMMNRHGCKKIDPKKKKDTSSSAASTSAVDKKKD